MRITPRVIKEDSNRWSHGVDWCALSVVHQLYVVECVSTVYEQFDILEPGTDYRISYFDNRTEALQEYFRALQAIGL
jgi:hypothetical protein